MQMLQRQSAQSEQVGKSGNAAENGGSSEAGGSQVKPSSQMEGQVPSSSRSVEEGPIEHQFGGGGGNSPIEKHGRQASSASPVKLIGGGGGGSGAAAKTAAAAAAAAATNSAEQASQTVTQSTAVATTSTVTGSHHHHNSSSDGSVLLFSSSAATQSANGFSALAANDHLNHHLNTYTAPDTVMSEDSSKLQAESSPSQLAAAADKLESSVHNSSNNNNNSSNNINNGNNGHWMTTASAAAGINTAKMFASRWTPAPASDQSASSSPTTSSSFSGLFDDRQTGDCGGMTLRGGEEGEEEEEASTVLKTRGLFSRRLREWESRLAAAAASTTFTTSGAFTTTLPRAYVMRINRLSCSNPLVLRPFAVDNTAAVDADADDSDDLGLNGEGHSNPPPSSFKNDLNTTSTALEYLMTSDEEEEEEEDSLMSNDGGGNFGILNSTDDSTNANSGGSCCKYRLKRPRLQCIEEEIANLNLDQSDSSSSATLDLPVLQTAPAALISSRPFNESNFNKTTTTETTTTTTTMIGSFKEKKEDQELRSSKEFTTSTNDPFALLPKKSEDRDGEPRCQVETASIQSLISAIKQFLADGKKESDANITVEGGKSEVSKMCLPMLKIVSFEAAKSLPTNSTDELQELAQKLSMNSNGSSPEEMTGATTSTIGKMFEKGRKQESVRNQQKGCIIANGSKSVEATAKSRRVSFLDSDDDDDDHISKAHISNHVVPNILSSLGNADQINPFGSVGRGFKEVVSPFLTKGAERNSRLHVLASATEMQEKLELQRAIMEDIEERAAKMKCSAAASSAATATTNTCQEEEEANGYTTGSFLNPNPRTLSSFLRPSTSVLSNINHSRRTASQENGGNSGATQKKEHSSLTALLQSDSEQDEQPISKTAAENGNGKSGNSGNNGEDSGQTLSFLERAKLQAARQPCHSLPPVSSFVGTLGGKNFELEEEGNSSSSNSAGGSSFSFLRSNGSAKAGLSAFSSSFLSGLITEAMGVDGSTSGGGGGGGGGGDTGSTTEPAAAATLSPSKKGTAPVFGGATSFNPNSPLTTAPLPNSSNSSESALSAAELEARNSRITRFFSKLAAEGESRADALALAAASTLSLISSAGVGGGAEKVQDVQEVAAENGTKNGTKDASNDGGKSTAQVAAPGASSSSSSTAAVATSAAQPPPYKPFTNYVDATSASAAATAGAAAASSSSAAASSSASSSANQPEKRVSGKAPMKRPFHQPQRWSKMDNISIGSGSSSPPPPLYYEDDEATMEMVLKMSAQEASLTKVSKKGGGGGSGGGGSSKAHCPVKSSKIPKTDNGLQISAGQKEGKSRGDDDNAKNDNDNENGSGKEVEMLLDDNDNDDDEELWRSIPSTSGTQKVKPAANEPIPGYPKLMKQTQQQQQSLLYYNQGQRSVVNTAHFSSSSSSSSSPSAGSYHPRPLNLVGQKRKREVTFIEMIKEGGGGDGRSPPPLPRPSSSSTSNGGEGGEMVVLEEEEEEEEEEEDDLLLLDDDADGIPARHSSKHQATELLQTRRRGHLSKLPLNPPVYSCHSPDAEIIPLTEPTNLGHRRHRRPRRRPELGEQLLLSSSSSSSSSAATASTSVSTTATEILDSDILIDSDSDEIIVPIVPRISPSQQLPLYSHHPDRKMAKARASRKFGKSSATTSTAASTSSSFSALPTPGRKAQTNKGEDEEEEDNVEMVGEMEPEEVLLLSPQYRSGHRKATASTSSHQVPIGSSFSSSSSSPWTTSGAGLGGRGGYSTYNIGATQQWDLNDRYWERFSVTFVTSCAAEVPEAVPVDICEALKIWRQPKAFELQAKRRYTVLLRRGPLKGEGSGGSSKGDKGGRSSGPERRAHERFRIVIGIDFYNSSSAERRHAIENWKFLEQEQAFGLATGGQKSTSQKKGLTETPPPRPRLFEVFPNGNTTSVDFFEFNDEDQQHSCFWSPENVRTFREGHDGDDEELHYDPDCSSTCTSFDLQFNCLTEHFANFMEIGENPMRLMIKVEKLLNTTKLHPSSSSSGGRHSSTDSKTAMIASDRPQRFEYAKVAKLSCGVRILDSDSGEAMNDKTSDTNPE